MRTNKFFEYNNGLKTEIQSFKLHTEKQGYKIYKTDFSNGYSLQFIAKDLGNKKIQAYVCNKIFEDGTIIKSFKRDESPEILENLSRILDDNI